MGFLSLFRRRESALEQQTKARARERSDARRAREEAARFVRSEDAAPIVLTSHAIAWADSLSPELKPRELMHTFPRIANRLALCWSDPRLRHLALEELLVDRRGGRRGFSPRVREEVVRLRIVSPGSP